MSIQNQNLSPNQYLFMTKLLQYFTDFNEDIVNYYSRFIMIGVV